MTKKSSKNKWEKFAEQNPSESAEEQPIEEIEQETDLGLEYPDRQALEDKLTAMEQKVSEYKDQNLRVLAQLKNTQERAQRDVANAHKFGNEKLVNDLLPILDSLTRGLENASEEKASVKNMREGIELTLNLFYKTLEKHGVEIISPKMGDAFNPDLHEAMTMQPDPKAKPNTILKVLQQGFSLNGRVIRAAMVIVAG